MMSTRKLFNLLLLSVMISLTACGGGDTEVQSESESVSSNSQSESNAENDEPKTVQEAMSEVKKAMEENGTTKEVVNFRDLKALLPESMMGMERTDFSGEKAGAFGFNVANAEAVYKDGEKRIEIKIVDVAGVSTAMMSMASWTTLEIDRESDDGYERTTTIDGYKAFEKYDANREKGEINIIVKDRFIITLDGRKVGEKELRKALDKINLKKLAKME